MGGGRGRRVAQGNRVAGLPAGARRRLEGGLGGVGVGGEAGEGDGNCAEGVSVGPNAMFGKVTLIPCGFCRGVVTVLSDACLEAMYIERVYLQLWGGYLIGDTRMCFN